jgi:hypothetical protein
MHAQIKEPIPSLAELGGHQLYPADPSVGGCAVSVRTGVGC